MQSEGFFHDFSIRCTGLHFFKVGFKTSRSMQSEGFFFMTLPILNPPPGTGKTLVARALANECSKGGKKVAFFMRKGADCLSKWVGESERQLRLLFDQV